MQYLGVLCAANPKTPFFSSRFIDRVEYECREDGKGPRPDHLPTLVWIACNMHGNWAAAGIDFHQGGVLANFHRCATISITLIPSKKSSMLWALTTCLQECYNIVN